MTHEWFAQPYTGGQEAMVYVKTDILPELLARFPAGVSAMDTPFDTPEWQVAPEQLYDVAAWLKARGFNMLLDVGGVDYLPRQPRFEVVYHLLALPNLWRVRLRVPVAEADARVRSVSDLWPAAAPAEREVWDLFGIHFDEHPGLTRILLPDDWQGHPLRKDYPIQGPRAQVPALAAERNRYHGTKRPAQRPDRGMTWSSEKGADERGADRQDG